MNGEQSPSGEDSAPIPDAAFAEQLARAREVQDEARQRLEAHRGMPTPAPAESVERIQVPTFATLSDAEVAELEARERRRIDREERHKRAERMSILPGGYRLRFGADESWLLRAPWKDFPAAVSLSRDIVERNPLRAVWVGSPAAGKTTLAVAALALWLDRYTGSALFVSSRELGLARARSPLGDSEPALVASALTVDLLVLDDLGDEQPAPMSAVPDVLHKRHEQGRRTWVTTWCTDDELVRRYGEGIARRVYDRADKCLMNPR